ncbi:hypothetical protein [Ammoniphilus sp. 3BR4]
MIQKSKEPVIRNVRMEFSGECKSKEEFHDFLAKLILKNEQHKSKNLTK